MNRAAGATTHPAALSPARAHGCEFGALKRHNANKPYNLAGIQRRRRVKSAPTWQRVLEGEGYTAEIRLPAAGFVRRSRLTRQASKRGKPLHLDVHEGGMGANGGESGQKCRTMPDSRSAQPGALGTTYQGTFSTTGLFLDACGHGCKWGAR